MPCCRDIGEQREEAIARYTLIIAFARRYASDSSD